MLCFNRTNALHDDLLFMVLGTLAHADFEVKSNNQWRAGYGSIVFWDILFVFELEASIRAGSDRTTCCSVVS
jgi:hypothetical protein